MEVRVRPIREGAELARLLEIWRQAYDLSDDALARWREGLRLEATRALLAGDEPVAVLQLLPLAVWVGPHTVPAGGIAGVAAPPEAPQRGATLQLLRACLAEMRERGLPLSALFPFSHRFYRKAGWEVAGAARSYRFPLSLLAPFLPGEGALQRADPQADLAHLRRLYDSAATARVGALVRSPDHWRREILPGPGPGRRFGYLWAPAPGEPWEGYLVYELGQERGTRYLQVREWVWQRERAWRGLAALLANHDSQAQEARWEAPADDLLLARLPEGGWQAETRLRPTFMLRIVDVPAALARRPVFTGGEGRVRLRVEDPDLPRNEGCYHLEARGGRLLVRGPTAERAELTCGVTTLARLYSGYLTCHEAWRLDLLAGDEAAAVRAGRLLDAPAPFMNDFF